MPNPKEMQPQKLSARQEEMLAGAGIPQMVVGRPHDGLASEIAALRADIAVLCAALVPVPSLILTGQQALDEFKRLSSARR